MKNFSTLEFKFTNFKDDVEIWFFGLTSEVLTTDVWNTREIN